MSLEAILSRIREEAEKKARAIISSAEQERDSALRENSDRLEEEFERDSERARTRIAESMKRKEFHVRREASRKLMNERRAMIDRAVDYAAGSLASAGDPEYLKMISALLQGCDLTGEVQVIISKDDEHRITESFLKKHSSAGRSFVLSPDRHESGGGVIFRSGDISQNGTFPMIAELAHEELVMELSDLVPLEKI